MRQPTPDDVPSRLRDVFDVEASILADPLSGTPVLVSRRMAQG